MAIFIISQSKLTVSVVPGNGYCSIPVQKQRMQITCRNRNYLLQSRDSNRYVMMRGIAKTELPAIVVPDRRHGAVGVQNHIVRPRRKYSTCTRYATHVLQIHSTTAFGCEPFLSL